MRSKWQTAERMADCLARMQRANALALIVCQATGLRISDVLLLASVQIMAAPVMAVLEHKTGRISLIELPPALRDTLKAQCSECWVFPGRFGGHRTRQAVWKDLKKAGGGREASKGLSPHSTRKIYAVGLLEALGSLKAVQEELGHTHLETTALYALSNML